jgi:hypothetical protein
MRVSLLVAFAVAVCAWTSLARADRAEELGGYEKQALATALRRLGLKLDPAPEGKLVDRLHIVNLDVFSEREGFLQWFNVFHWTSRDYVVEREVLLQPGQVWDEELVAETKRRLNDPLFTTLVVVVPVASQTPGRVDLLVVTRDIWSLRMNSQFEVQDNVLTQLSVSLSENNVFGLRKQAAFVFDMDLGQFSLGPQYVDKNIAGTRLQLSTRVSALFSRSERDFEGTASTVIFGYPLWSLRSKWGASIVASHFDSTVRQFFGPNLRLYDNPDTAEQELIPRKFDFRVIGIETSGVRSFGEDVKQRITVGHTLSIRRPSLLDDFGQTGIPLPTKERIEIARDAFERDVLPRSERVSSVFARYSVFTPDFIVYRNLDSYDLPEDVRLGPELGLELSTALRAIGSEENFVGLSAGVGWTLDLARDGLIGAAANAGGRIQGDDFRDGSVGASVRLAVPTIARAFRIVGRVAYAQLIDDTNNNFLSVGGDSGLRGYAISQFTGQLRARGNLEVRSMPLTFLFSRFGALAFWDVGHAADSLDALVLHHDIGLGLRAIVPQLQPVVFRLDYAIPLTGDTAGFPGRFSAGIAQAF